MASVDGVMEVVVLVALALGTLLAAWILEACTALTNAVSRKLYPHRRPDPFVGGALFLFLMIGIPAIVVVAGAFMR